MESQGGRARLCKKEWWVWCSAFLIYYNEMFSKTLDPDLKSRNVNESLSTTQKSN